MIVRQRGRAALLYPEPVFERAALSPLEVQENVELAPYTTIGIGGPARFFAKVTSEAQLLRALWFAEEHGLAVLMLGGGSNLLVRDGGFPGLAIHLTIDAPLERREAEDSICIRVAAGVPWDGLVDVVCDQDLSGMECLAGIPGLTGGTPIQNVGAYGQEVSQTITCVRALDRRAGGFVEILAADCNFAYRSSRFNARDRDRFVITAVEFRLDRATRPALQYADLKRHFGDRHPGPAEVARAVREIRRGKGMVVVAGDPDSRSAGSFFKNPVVTADAVDRVAAEAGVSRSEVPYWPAEQGRVKLAAAWLLERAGFHKGFALGQAGISSRHTLALINRGYATFAELAALRDTIRDTVQARFGIVLEQEPVEAGEAA